jgi:diaminobutyrate-2-oxoglutarate transaminase
VNTIDYLRKVLGDTSSGVDKPAAVIVETIQAEGGVNVASIQWLQDLAAVCREHGVLLIVDDIQVGCGRAGSFFSFERAGIVPDIVVLSKAISGYGLPMALVLLRPALDQWKPGEHTGTFRGNNMAFVAATEALRYWETEAFTDTIATTSMALERGLRTLGGEFPEIQAKVRGLGMIFGLEFAGAAQCSLVAREAFSRGLVIETCGSGKNVLKFLPPLTIDEATLEAGLGIVREAIRATLAAPATRQSA